MTMLEKITGEWGTECRCFICTTCETWLLGDGECPDCGNAPEPFGYCNGDCQDPEREDFTYWFDKWLGDATGYVIHANGMGWTRQNATSAILRTAEDAMTCLNLNGDYTITWTLDGESLTAVRRSHDEMGALFIFDKEIGECDECGGIYDPSSRDGRCGDCGLCGDCCYHGDEEII